MGIGRIDGKEGGIERKGNGR
jgi:hypothetical protein